MHDSSASSLGWLAGFHTSFHGITDLLLLLHISRVYTHCDRKEIQMFNLILSTEGKHFAVGCCHQEILFYFLCSRHPLFISFFHSVEFSQIKARNNWIFPFFSKTKHIHSIILRASLIRRPKTLNQMRAWKWLLEFKIQILSPSAVRYEYIIGSNTLWLCLW
jgi:hypothetical protein